MTHNNISFSQEEAELLYSGMNNYRDASDSHPFYDEETDTETIDEDKFFDIFESLMAKLRHQCVYGN